MQVWTCFCCRLHDLWMLQSNIFSDIVSLFFYQGLLRFPQCICRWHWDIIFNSIFVRTVALLCQLCASFLGSKSSISKRSNLCSIKVGLKLVGGQAFCNIAQVSWTTIVEKKCTWSNFQIVHKLYSWNQKSREFINYCVKNWLRSYQPFFYRAKIIFPSLKNNKNWKIVPRPFRILSTFFLFKQVLKRPVKSILL